MENDEIGDKVRVIVIEGARDDVEFVLTRMNLMSGAKASMPPVLQESEVESNVAFTKPRKRVLTRSGFKRWTPKEDAMLRSVMLLKENRTSAGRIKHSVMLALSGMLGRSVAAVTQRISALAHQR